MKIKGLKKKDKNLNKQPLILLADYDKLKLHYNNGMYSIWCPDNDPTEDFLLFKNLSELKEFATCLKEALLDNHIGV